MLVPVSEEKRLMNGTLAMGAQMMSSEQRDKFMEVAEVIGHGVPGLGASRQRIPAARGRWGMVLRVIPPKIPSVADLLLPLCFAASRTTSAARAVTGM